jgi:hypothetical protein
LADIKIKNNKERKANEKCLRPKIVRLSSVLNCVAKKAATATSAVASMGEEEEKQMSSR